MRWIAAAFVIAVLALPVAAQPVCSAGEVWNYCTCGDCAVHGPANWGKIGAPNWPECSGSTITQSPVSLEHSTFENLGRLVLTYQKSGLAMANTGSAVKMMPAKRQFVTLGKGPHLYLQEFHFHVPAEHTLPGVKAVAELHLVHAATPTSKPTAVGVLLVEGTENPQLDALIAAAAKIPMCAKKETPAEVSLEKLVPQSLASSFLEYDGSLTTPACTPVRWLVLKNTITISKRQLEKLNLFGANARPNTGMHAAVKCWPAGENCKP